MIKAIYKIENKINHKIYIGQSNDPERRFQDHCRIKSANDNSLITKAIQKYGKENFSLEILGWFEDYNKKEKEYIKQYDSRVPNGYNVAEGGEEPPRLCGEENPHAAIDNKTAKNVRKQLLDWKIPRKTIIEDNNITADIIRHINEGDSWRDKELSYPLRPKEKTLNEYRALYIKWLCCNSDLSLNSLGALVGWGRSSAKMINQGVNHRDERLKYPIRDNKEYNKQILDQEPCIDYLHFGEQ